MITHIFFLPLLHYQLAHVGQFSMSHAGGMSLLDEASSLTPEIIIERLAAHFRSNRAKYYYYPRKGKPDWPLMTDFYGVILGSQQRLTSFQVQQLSLHSRLSNKVRESLRQIARANTPAPNTPVNILPDPEYLKQFLVTISYSWPGGGFRIRREGTSPLDPFHHLKLEWGVPYAINAPAPTQGKVICCSVTKRPPIDRAKLGLTGMERFVTGVASQGSIGNPPAFGHPDFIVPLYEILLPRDYFKAERHTIFKMFFPYGHNPFPDDAWIFTNATSAWSNEDIDELTIQSGGRFIESNVSDFLRQQVFRPTLGLLNRFIGFWALSLVSGQSEVGSAQQQRLGGRELGVPDFDVMLGDQFLFPIEVKSHLGKDFGATYQDKAGSERFISKANRNIILQILRYMIKRESIYSLVLDPFNGYVLELTGDFYTATSEEQRTRIFNSLNDSSKGEKTLNDDDIIRFVKIKKIRLSYCGTDSEGEAGPNSGMNLKFGFMCLVLKCLKETLDLNFDRDKIRVKTSIGDKMKELGYNIDTDKFEKFVNSGSKVQWSQKTTSVHEYLKPSTDELLRYGSFRLKALDGPDAGEIITIPEYHLRFYSSSTEIKVVQPGDYSHAVVLEFPVKAFYTIFRETLSQSTLLFLQILMEKNNSEDSIIVKIYDLDVQQYSHEKLWYSGESIGELPWYVDSFKRSFRREIEAFKTISEHNRRSKREVIGIPGLISHGRLLLIDESTGSLLCCGEFIAMVKIKDDFQNQPLVDKLDDFYDINQQLKDQLKKKVHNQLRELAKLKYYHSDLYRRNILLKKITTPDGDVKEIKPYFIDLAGLVPQKQKLERSVIEREIENADYALFSYERFNYS